VFATFGKRGAPALLALMRMKDKANLLEQQLEATTTSAKDMAETRLDTMEGSLLILRASFQNFQIALGEQLAPTIRDIVDAFAELFKAATDSFRQITGGGEKSIVSTQGLITALFTVLDVISGVWKGMKLVGNIFSFVWNSAKLVVGVAVLAITGLIAGLLNIVMLFLNKIGVMSDGTVSAIQDTMGAFLGSVVDSTEEAAKAAGSAAEGAWNSLDDSPMDKWADQTKRNLEKNMGAAGKSAAEKLSDELVTHITQKPLLTEADIALGEATDTLQKWIEKQEEAVAVFGMTEAEAEIYTATMAGVSQITIDQATAVQQQILALEKQQELMKKGESLMQSLRTPSEKYADDIKDIQELLGAGAITQETFTRAMAKAKEDMEKGITVEVEGVVQGMDSAMGKFNVGVDLQTNLAKTGISKQDEQIDWLKKISESIGDSPTKVAPRLMPYPPEGPDSTGGIRDISPLLTPILAPVDFPSPKLMPHGLDNIGDPKGGGTPTDFSPSLKAADDTLKVGEKQVKILETISKTLKTSNLEQSGLT